MGLLNLLPVLAEGSFSWGSAISASDFEPIVSGMKEVVPVLIGGTIGIVVVRKVFSFIVGRIRKV